MKKTIILIAGLIILSAGAFYFFNNQKSDQDQIVLEKTLNISKEYATLRYRTENVLVNAEDYAEYDNWNNEMSDIINKWKELESDALNLEESATKMAEEKMAFKLAQSAYAYDSVEIQKVIENAPAGKQIRTLAKHLGVDAKMAQLILNQTQDQITREAYGEEGDVFETCEQNSMRIKNSAKVTVFVGGVVFTGGMAGVAASGVVAKTALVVGGADLVLEVADDEAKIALGDKNKVSEMVGKVRTVTEPAASILTIVNMPGNLSKAMEKISAISFAGDQIRSVVQDEKILGISIKTDDKGEVKAQVSGLTEDELVEWRKENNALPSGETIAEALNIKNNTEATNQKEQPQETKSQETDQTQETESSNIEQPQETATNSIKTQKMAGTYSGSAILQHVEEDVESPDSLPVTLQLNENGTGTVNVNGYGGEAYYAGNNVSFSVNMKEGGAVVNCSFEGKATSNGGQTAISGSMYFSMMGVTFASYSWSAQQ